MHKVSFIFSVNVLSFAILWFPVIEGIHCPVLCVCLCFNTATFALLTLVACCWELILGPRSRSSTPNKILFGTSLGDTLALLLLFPSLRVFFGVKKFYSLTCVFVSFFSSLFNSIRFTRFHKNHISIHTPIHIRFSSVDFLFLSAHVAQILYFHYSYFCSY